MLIRDIPLRMTAKISMRVWMRAVGFRRARAVARTKERSLLTAALSNLTDDDANFAAILADVGLRRSAPATVQQSVGGLHARSRWILWLAHDRREVTNTLCRIRPAK